MNQLNEKLRILRTQITAEKKQSHPNIERLNELKNEEQKCLQQLLKYS